MTPFKFGLYHDGPLAHPRMLSGTEAVGKAAALWGNAQAVMQSSAGQCRPISTLQSQGREPWAPPGQG
jgi:hypothetical protein